MSGRIIRDLLQTDLEQWIAGRHRRGDPVTSVKAAKSVKTPTVVERIRRLLITFQHGLTAEEMSAALRVRLQTITPRLRPMEDAGLILRSGRVRKGSSGRERIIWIAAPDKEVKPPDMG